MQQNLLSLLVINQCGVLMRIAGIFSRRTCNIKSITAAETRDAGYTRITILFEASEDTAGQIAAMLEKQEDVVGVARLDAGCSVARELVLLKVQNSPALQSGLTRLEKGFSPRVLAGDEENLILEFTGDTEHAEEFVRLMEQYGAVKFCRSGAAALALDDGAQETKQYPAGYSQYAEPLPCAGDSGQKDKIRRKERW